MAPTEREDTMLLTPLLREAVNDARNYEVMIACVYDYGWTRYPFLHIFGQTCLAKVEL